MQLKTECIIELTIQYSQIELKHVCSHNIFKKCIQNFKYATWIFKTDLTPESILNFRI